MLVSGLADDLPELEASLETDPSPRNVMKVADAWRLAGQPQRAIAALSRLIVERPGAIAPRVLLAWCHRDAGSPEAAQRMIEEVRGLDPANPFVREETVPEPAAGATEPGAAGASSVQLGLVGGESSTGSEPPWPEPSPEEREQAAEPERPLTPDELADVPPNALYSATLAEIFERQGFEEKAIEIYSTVVRRHPERADLRERIAELARRLPLEPSP